MAGQVRRVVLGPGAQNDLARLVGERLLHPEELKAVEDAICRIERELGADPLRGAQRRGDDYRVYRCFPLGVTYRIVQIATPPGEEVTIEGVYRTPRRVITP